jgi:hypothetical protein
MEWDDTEAERLNKWTGKLLYFLLE